MNASPRPLWAAVCLLTVLLPGFAASAQFLPPEIIQARQINANQRMAIDKVVAPAMGDLIDGDAKAMAEARKKMLGHLGNPSASDAFQNAYSELVTAKMDRAVNHDSQLVRMNAMIILSRMTDEGSKQLIDAGIEDKSIAVQRWAFEALRQRVRTWIRRDKNGNGPQNLNNLLDGVINQVNGKLDQQVPPNPIVVEKALLTLLEINTAASRKALIEHLNKRVALHAKDAKLSYAGEQAVLEQFASVMSLERPFKQQDANGLSRAAYRYARLILDQAKAGNIGKANLDDALGMLNQCITAMGQIAAGAGKNPPAAQGQATGAIQNEQWDVLDGLLNEWAIILRAAPFGLTNEDLAVE